MDRRPIGDTYRLIIISDGIRDLCVRYRERTSRINRRIIAVDSFMIAPWTDDDNAQVSQLRWIYNPLGKRREGGGYITTAAMRPSPERFIHLIKGRR